MRCEDGAIGKTKKIRKRWSQEKKKRKREGPRHGQESDPRMLSTQPNDQRQTRSAPCSARQRQKRDHELHENAPRNFIAFVVVEHGDKGVFLFSLCLVWCRGCFLSSLTGRRFDDLPTVTTVTRCRCCSEHGSPSVSSQMDVVNDVLLGTCALG